MADVKPLPSKPCKFEIAWHGKCGKPSTNGWCSGHENKKCVSCGKHATHSCGSGMSLVCGAFLCNHCAHSPDRSGPSHVSKKIADEFNRKKIAEEKARIASRTSRIIRKDEKLGVPLNLFELLKGNPQGYRLQNFFYLEIKHGLMGFFPAIFAGTERMVVTPDINLIEQVWKIMPIEDSAVRRNLGYINHELGVLYGVTEQNPYDQERSLPQKFLTETEFNELTSKGRKPFGWAPGLLCGGGGMDETSFLRMIEASITKEKERSMEPV